MAMTQSRRMHGAMESGEPLIVTALSVEPGNISLATWIDAPVDCRKSQTNKTHKLQTDSVKESKLSSRKQQFGPSWL